MAKTKSVLIIGGSGFIGTHLALRLREGYKVFATYNTRCMSIPGVTYLPLTVTNRNWVKRVVYTANPDAIIYAAGANDPFWAESDPRGAESVHTGGPATVSNLADILQPKFIYLSNSYTFDGNRGNYKETDIILPGTALGKAKVGGENFIRGKSLNYIIVRSSPVYGRGNGWKRSFFDRLRMGLDRGQRIELAGNELQSFAPVSGLVDFIARLVDSGPRNKILHYGGLTKVTAYEFGRLLAKRFGYDPNLILLHRPPAVTEAEQKQGGPQVDPDHLWDFSLNSTHIIENLKIRPLSLEEGFDRIDEELRGKAIG